MNQKKISVSLSSEIPAPGESQETGAPNSCEILSSINHVSSHIAQTFSQVTRFTNSKIKNVWFGRTRWSGFDRRCRKYLSRRKLTKLHRILDYGVPIRIGLSDFATGAQQFRPACNCPTCVWGGGLIFGSG